MSEYNPKYEPLPNGSIKLGFDVDMNVAVIFVGDDGKEFHTSLPVNEWQRIVRQMDEEIKKEGLE